jgi:hypothetical protein
VSLLFPVGMLVGLAISIGFIIHRYGKRGQGVPTESGGTRGVWGDGSPPKRGLGGWVPPQGGSGGMGPPQGGSGGMGPPQGGSGGMGPPRIWGVVPPASTAPRPSTKGDDR